MYDQCTTLFDIRHVVIAVNPDRIEMYESLLFFRRLTSSFVANYGYANGAPAVGAALDLKEMPRHLKRAYQGKRPRKSLYHYFIKLKLPNMGVPSRRFYTTTDPVMTPEMLNYFFNQRTQGFNRLGDREKALLYSIYSLPHYGKYLPVGFSNSDPGKVARQHQRYAFKCSGTFTIELAGHVEAPALTVVDCSLHGFLAYATAPVTCQVWGDVMVQLGPNEESRVRALAVGHKKDAGFYGFKLAEPDVNWRKFVAALTAGTTRDERE